jgi:hypothetical protein
MASTNEDIVVLATAEWRVPHGDVSSGLQHWRPDDRCVSIHLAGEDPLRRAADRSKHCASSRPP